MKTKQWVTAAVVGCLSTMSAQAGRGQEGHGGEIVVGRAFLKLVDRLQEQLGGQYDLKSQTTNLSIRPTLEELYAETGEEVDALSFQTDGMKVTKITKGDWFSMNCKSKYFLVLHEMFVHMGVEKTMNPQLSRTISDDLFSKGLLSCKGLEDDARAQTVPKLVKILIEAHTLGVSEKYKKKNPISENTEWFWRNNEDPGGWSLRANFHMNPTLYACEQSSMWFFRGIFFGFPSFGHSQYGGFLGTIRNLADKIFQECYLLHYDEEKEETAQIQLAIRKIIGQTTTDSRVQKRIKSYGRMYPATRGVLFLEKNRWKLDRMLFAGNEKTWADLLSKQVLLETDGTCAVSAESLKQEATKDHWSARSIHGVASRIRKICY